MKKLLFLCLCSFALANPIIIAEKAGFKDAPENSLIALKLALKNKADMIHISVQLSKDKKLVLYHYKDLSVLSDKKGKISEFDLKELKKIPLHTKEKIYNGDNLRILSLDEVLKKFPENSFIIEPILNDSNEKEMAKILYESVQKDLERIRIYSKNDKLLLSLNENVPKFAPYSKTFDKFLKAKICRTCETEEIPKTFYAFDFEKEVKILDEENEKSFKLTWDEEAVMCFKQNEGEIFLFNADSTEAYEKAKNLNIDAIFTSKPSLFKDN
ncbi:glycerophosphodiester phosphodiesterase family protein [Campylobacter helveticus]|uniref:glycerophosphodiester phosphodiesterase family protein n=1 Tax=Campylobacter helveticus TaxID=28898 RepID=UPI00214A17CF|nr:glycerophosphodiester phosphodiesterase family protein [Campylobacter helveticus]MCR2065829.1 hypothetical protein [Campylobacter helveticus]